MKNIKQLFIEYLSTKSAIDSGKPSSYAKAMEVLEDVLFEKAFSNSISIWTFINVENIEEIYDFVKKQQKDKNSIFKNYTPSSYWKKGYCSAALKEYGEFIAKESLQNKKHFQQQLYKDISKNSIILPKPFILLAGISGTGKTRFVLEQAERSANAFALADNYNCCLIPVRPDWHEPSDLLGYISRISGTHYISTDFLIFIIKAWCNAIDSINNQDFKLKPIDQIAPFWLCLDEMNLAPVEQYFSDYLSILETRKWEDGEYSCQPLLKKELLGTLRYSNTGTGIEPENSLESLWLELFKDIDIEQTLKDSICEYFELNGIALPPNLIVAGTVNMDETTHGFSRKVIDRALTIDFGGFFPNDYDSFFAEDKKSRQKILSYSLLTQAAKEDLADTYDTNGDKSIIFLKAVNTVLKQTPFELAYRALNELLLQLACFKPQTEAHLQAVWDDFLMSKVLPRIDGDEDKLRNIKEDADNNLLESLSVLLEQQLHEIWDAERIDFYREKMDGSAINDISCRSKAKLLWMNNRLEINTFTSYWP